MHYGIIKSPDARQNMTATIAPATKAQKTAAKNADSMPAFARMMRATVFACGEEALIEGAADNGRAAEKRAAA